MFAGTFLYEPSFVNGLRGFHPYGVSVTASNQKTLPQQKRPTKKKDTSDDCRAQLWLLATSAAHSPKDTRSVQRVREEQVQSRRRCAKRPNKKEDTPDDTQLWLSSELPRRRRIGSRPAAASQLLLGHQISLEQNMTRATSRSDATIYMYNR